MTTGASRARRGTRRCASSRPVSASGVAASGTHGSSTRGQRGRLESFTSASNQESASFDTRPHGFDHPGRLCERDTPEPEGGDERGERRASTLRRPLSCATRSALAFGAPTVLGQPGRLPGYSSGLRGGGGFWLSPWRGADGALSVGFSRLSLAGDEVHGARAITRIGALRRVVTGWPAVFVCPSAPRPQLPRRWQIAEPRAARISDTWGQGQVEVRCAPGVHSAVFHVLRRSPLPTRTPEEWPSGLRQLI